MKKVLMCICAALVICVAVGCNDDNVQYGQPIEPIEVIREQYDPKLTIELVEHIEQPILYLLSLDEISRDEFESLIQESEIISSGLPETAYALLKDGADYDDEQKEVLELNVSYFCPTIFHEGIEITDAYIEYSTYEDTNAYLDSTILYVVEEYCGDDEILKDLNINRTYSFVLKNDSDWVYRGRSGSFNYMGEGLSSTYLPLK